MIILIGYMGSGKTAVGQALSDKINKTFIDLDNYIAKQEEMSIPEIFEKKGEIYFRKKEYIYLKELLEKNTSEIILSVGGGTPCYGENMKMINEASDNVFYLKATIDTLCDRLSKEKNERPLISHLSDNDMQEFIRKHLFERNFYYLQARHKIDVDTLSVDEIVEKIETLL